MKSFRSKAYREHLRERMEKLRNYYSLQDGVPRASGLALSDSSDDGLDLSGYDTEVRGDDAEVIEITRHSFFQPINPGYANADSENPVDSGEDTDEVSDYTHNSDSDHDPAEHDPQAPMPLIHSASPESCDVESLPEQRVRRYWTKRFREEDKNYEQKPKRMRSRTE